MKIITLSEAPKVPFNIDGHVMHSSSSLEVIHLCLKPGEEIAQHKNPYDVVVCVVEGNIILLTKDTLTELKIYAVAEVEKSIDRGFRNNGTVEARLLILKKLI
jgi:quercetin dioxygenase-like cupin family protein